MRRKLVASTTPHRSSIAMAEFVYLYRRSVTPTGTPQQMQEYMQRWQAWFKDLEKQGHLANIGQPLAGTGGVVKDKRGGFSDGPYAETKDVVMGYSLIAAETLEQARSLATGCPIFEQGGLVEVRPVMKM
jgi:hypothetical protein